MRTATWRAVGILAGLALVAILLPHVSACRRSCETAGF
jgi:hypothetical protein